MNEDTLSGRLENKIGTWRARIRATLLNKPPVEIADEGGRGGMKDGTGYIVQKWAAGPSRAKTVGGLRGDGSHWSEEGSQLPRCAKRPSPTKIPPQLLQRGANDLFQNEVANTLALIVKD